MTQPPPQNLVSKTVVQLAVHDSYGPYFREKDFIHLELTFTGVLFHHFILQANSVDYLMLKLLALPLIVVQALMLSDMACGKRAMLYIMMGSWVGRNG